MLAGPVVDGNGEVRGQRLRWVEHPSPQPYARHRVKERPPWSWSASFEPQPLEQVRPGGEEPRSVRQPPARAALPLTGQLLLAHLAPVDAAPGRVRIVLDPELDALRGGAVGQPRGQRDRHVDARGHAARGDELAVFHPALPHVMRAELVEL